MTNTEPTILFTNNEGVAIIEICNPDRGNALNENMRAQIRDAWNEIETNSAIDVAIITGAGDRHFCTGAEVSRLSGKANSDVDEQRRQGPGGWSSRQYNVTKPVICALNGLAAGGGLHFVVDADIILATRAAAITDTHVNIGQVGALENIGLAKRLPLGTALRITLMGKKYRLSAERAYALGLIDELFDTTSELQDSAIEMARIIQQNSPNAMKLSKEAIWQSLELPYEDALKNGWRLICDQRMHPDAKEGVAAFKEKRPPRWTRD